MQKWQRVNNNYSLVTLANGESEEFKTMFAADLKVPVTKLESLLKQWQELFADWQYVKGILRTHRHAMGGEVL